MRLKLDIYVTFASMVFLGRHRAFLIAGMWSLAIRRQPWKELQQVSEGGNDRSLVKERGLVLTFALSAFLSFALIPPR